MSLQPNIFIPGNGQFSDHERAAVYRVIFERRDVRRNFLRTPIADDVLARILTAAHHAGSVGFMQPWDFVVIRQSGTKRAVKQLFQKTNVQAAMHYEGDRATLYRYMGTRQPGQPIALRIYRGSQAHTVTIAAGDVVAFFA